MHIFLSNYNNAALGENNQWHCEFVTTYFNDCNRSFFMERKNSTPEATSTYTVVSHTLTTVDHASSTMMSSYT